MIGSPVVFQPLFSFLNKTAHHWEAASSLPEISLFHLAEICGNSLLACVWWIYAGFFSVGWAYFLHPTLKIFMCPAKIKDFWDSSLSGSNALVMLCGSASSMILFSGLRIAGRSISRELFYKRHFFIGLLTLLLFSYILILGAVRLNSQNLSHILGSQMYYGYPFWLLALVWMASMIDSDKSGTVLLPKSRWIPAAAFAFLIGFNGFMVYQLNTLLRERSTSYLSLLNNVDCFVSEHCKEADFSFAVKRGIPWNTSLERPTKNLPPDVTLLELLYRKHIDRQHPKYVFDGAKWMLVRVEDRR